MTPSPPYLTFSFYSCHLSDRNIGEKHMETDTYADLSAANFRAPESLSIGTQLHRILRAAIIRGELAPGQAISEIEIGKKFSVSRQPVREAFIKLG